MVTWSNIKHRAPKQSVSESSKASWVFSVNPAVFLVPPHLSVLPFTGCIPLFHIAGLSPGDASSRRVTLISTCVDMTGISSEGLFCSFSIPFLFFTSPISSVSSSALLPHSHSLSFSLPHCLSLDQGFLINGEPWCLSYQQITLLSINHTGRAGTLQGMDDIHTSTRKHTHTQSGTWTHC